jgi:hypothetical protein
VSLSPIAPAPAYPVRQVSSSVARDGSPGAQASGSFPTERRASDAARVAAAGLRRMPITPAPMDGPCAGAKSKAGMPYGRCYSCAQLGPKNAKFAPTLSLVGGVFDCADWREVASVHAPTVNPLNAGAHP